MKQRLIRIYYESLYFIYKSINVFYIIKYIYKIYKTNYSINSQCIYK